MVMVSLVLDPEDGRDIPPAHTLTSELHAVISQKRELFTFRTRLNFFFIETLDNPELYYN
jgi:hypothetical protein